jgi:aspartate/methionine/tyrosine aminotransferase
MGESERTLRSEYLEWIKTRSESPVNLTASGVTPYRLRDLGATLEDLELTGPGAYGYEPLQAALAAKCGVAPECVVAAMGTSLANHLAMAALVAPGDEVVIERPFYEPLAALARYLGAAVRFFERRPEEIFRIDPEAVRRQVTPRTRLIVVTNLHNPSGVLADEETLRELGEIARGAGARVLVDEVYLEMLWVEGGREAAAGGDGGSPVLPSACRLGKEFVVTSSLTKAYGLNGLRCGWILAEPELAHRIWRLTDLFAVISAHPAECLSVVALRRLDRIADRSRALLARNRALLDAFFDAREDLEVVRPLCGTISFPRLRRGSVEGLCSLLRERYETAVVPGRFFGAPDHFRIGIGAETEVVAEGLKRLAAALDELAASSAGGR